MFEQNKLKVCFCCNFADAKSVMGGRVYISGDPLRAQASTASL